jgi:AraC-like DNA-binding protein
VYAVPALEQPYLVFLLVTKLVGSIADHVALVPGIVGPFSPESTLVGVGRTYGDPLKISRSFLESLSAPQLRRVGNSNAVVLFRTGRESADPEGYHAIRSRISQFSARLVLHSRSTASLHSALDDIWTSLVELDATVLMARHVYADVVAELTSAASGTPGERALRHLPALDDIYAFEHDVEFSRLRNALDRALDDLAAQAATAGDVARVREYIGEHCSDPDLSLEQIAEAVSLSYHYLSHMFRERTGRTVVTEIATARIERFKELASESDRPIAELCMEIGYRGPQQFCRVFKKHEGITPSQFRALARR